MLTARRGLGIDEHRLLAPEFEEAVHWATFAEHMAPRLADLREVVALDPSDDMRGQELTGFNQNRALTRAELTELEAALYPPDEAT